MAALMVAVYGGKDRLAGLMFWSTSGIMGLLGLWLAFSEPVISSAFNGSFINDGYARFAKVIILFGSASMLLLSQDYLEKNKLFKFEFPILIALAALGMNVDGICWGLDGSLYGFRITIFSIVCSCFFP